MYPKESCQNKSLDKNFADGLNDWDLRIFWDPQPRTLSRNTQILLQDEHSKTGEPLRVLMDAWGSPATGEERLFCLAIFPLSVLWCGAMRRIQGENRLQSNWHMIGPDHLVRYRRPFLCVYLIWAAVSNPLIGPLCKAPLKYCDGAVDGGHYYYAPLPRDHM